MTDRPKIKSVETKYYEAREDLFRDLKNLDRRSFMKLSMAAMGAAASNGVFFNPHSFLPMSFQGTGGDEVFRIAYISDSHLYEKKVNERFVRQLLRAVDDINSLVPAPDFVLYGGDLAQLGKPEELELGAEILKNVRVPVRMMVGEHDWFFDMGQKWMELFGPPNYSFEHKGVHFVTLNSIHEDDFWTARGMTPMERMLTVAGLDNGIQGRFKVGEPQREWLRKDLANVPKNKPLVVFSHSPLYKYYKPWNFWTDDAEEVQAILAPFDSVTVVHGHTHQLLTNRIGNIHFHGMLSTAWPWPYAPEGLPELTIQMNRANPFDTNDGLGNGTATVHASGLVDKVYNLWNRNPIEVSGTYLKSRGKSANPPKPNLASY